MAITPELQDAVDVRMGLIPEELASFLKDVDTIEQFTKRTQVLYGLDELQTTRLSNEIVLTVLLFSPMYQLDKTLAKQLEIDNTTAASIAHDIRNDLFTDEVHDKIWNVNIEQELYADSDVSSDETAVETGVIEMPVTEVAEELSTIDSANAQSLPVEPIASIEQNDKDLSEQNVPETQTKPPVSAQASTSSLSERFKALRTMQGDAERIHGYGAYRRKYPGAEEKLTSDTTNARTDLPKYDSDK